MNTNESIFCLFSVWREACRPDVVSFAWIWVNCRWYSSKYLRRRCYTKANNRHWTRVVLTVANLFEIVNFFYGIKTFGLNINDEFCVLHVLAASINESKLLDADNGKCPGETMKVLLSSVHCGVSRILLFRVHLLRRNTEKRGAKTKRWIYGVSRCHSHGFPDFSLLLWSRFVYTFFDVTRHHANHSNIQLTCTVKTLTLRCGHITTLRIRWCECRRTSCNNNRTKKERSLSNKTAGTIYWVIKNSNNHRHHHWRQRRQVENSANRQ